jgi:DNA-binding MarR family transcriptional regulator
MATHAYNALASAIETAGRNQLDDYSRQVWRAHGAGIVGDDQAQQLQERIQQRRQPIARFTTMVVNTESVPRYTIQRSPEQRSPDRRASLLRRREHAATGPLPPNLAATFTTGELAALKVLADECLAHGGVSDRSRNEIGARAGVSQTVVKRAIRYAERDGLISVLRRPRSGRKHLTNIIRIISAEWLDWLSKGRRKAYAIAACNRAKPDFPFSRGAQKDPPRSQVLRKAGSERVDKTVEKGNRTGASRA